MRKLCTFLSILAIAFALQAQDGKLRVAVFDPSSSGTPIDEGTKVAVRELISSTFVNTGRYTIVERSLLQQIMKEQEFSNTDVVDDSQATQLGKLAGANKVVLSVVTLVGGRNMLSIKIIDVQTATIDQQKTKIVTSSDLLDVVEPLTLEVLGEKVVYPSNTPPPAAQKQEVVETPPVQQPPVQQPPVQQQPVQQQPEQQPVQQPSTITVSSTMFCGLEVMTTDLPGMYQWAAAQRACPLGWRLPTSRELECLCDNKKRIGGFYGKQYWTSEISPKRSDKAITRTMNDGKVEIEDVNYEYCVRCVR